MSIVREIKNIIEPAYKVIYRLCIGLFYHFPIQRNKIVFIQSCGEGYCCNLKYVAEEIHRQNLNYDLIWMVDKYIYEIPSFIRKVKYNRIRAVYELATARVFINNSKSLYPVKKKRDQVFIYIPHGQPGCKCAEGDAVLPENYLKASKSHSMQTDVFVSMGKYHTQVLKDTFWVSQKAQIWEVGFPRNDQYYCKNIEKTKQIRERLNIPRGTCIAFYAPTFRDSGKVDAYNLDLHKVLKTLERKTGNKWMFFVTLHPNFKWFAKPPYPFDKNICDMSWYPDIHELLSIADIAISDYSSVALDFANSRKPVFLYASDIDDYTHMRGLKPMYYQMPFPLAKNNEEMEQNIIKYNREERLRQFDEWVKVPYGSIDDGHASERFVERLKQIMQ